MHHVPSPTGDAAIRANHLGQLRINPAFPSPHPRRQTTSARTCLGFTRFHRHLFSLSNRQQHLSSLLQQFHRRVFYAFMNYTVAPVALPIAFLAHQ
jgi:hypothetical protein